MCPDCRLVRYARVLPYHCRCGRKHWAGAEPPAPRPREKPPRTFGRVLQALAGCGCSSVPWAAWDSLGLDWCRDNADRIAKRLASEPKTGLSEGRAREMVQLAIEIAGRASER